MMYKSDFDKKTMINMVKKPILMLAVSSISLITYAEVSPAQMSSTSTLSNQASVSSQTVNTSQTDAEALSNLQNSQEVAYGVIASLVKVNEQGQETKQPITSNTQLKTGDIIEYQGNFTNLTESVVASMQVTLSIPESTVLLQQPDKLVLASVDGNKFYQMPLKASVNGEVKALELSRYRALRWTISNLESKQTANVVYRAKLAF